MKQTFEKIRVEVKLYPYDYEYLGVYEGYELNCFDWSGKPCYEYGEANFFTISKDKNIRTVAEARVLIDEFNNHFGLNWKRSQFRLECTSTIKL